MKKEYKADEVLNILGSHFMQENPGIGRAKISLRCVVEGSRFEAIELKVEPILMEVK